MLINFFQTRFGIRDSSPSFHNFKMFPKSIYFEEMQNDATIKQLFIPLKIVPLCNDTLLPAAASVLETVLEAIL
jgi:hypothetical protein